MKSVLVTGATGFIGNALCKLLIASKYTVRVTMLPTEHAAVLGSEAEATFVQPLGPDTCWASSLFGIDIVIHLAARVHIMDDPSTNPLDEFRKVNVEGTLKLARDCVSVGVRRFVYVSSIKVNGEENIVPYTPYSLPKPTDPYGISKWEAEQGLRKIASETALEVVIVRPTLVYGPGVKANFLNMMKIISKGIPLPLASINNKRSLIYVENLVDALAICATHPKAAGQTFLVSDGEDVSTPELIHRTASSIGMPTRLFPFPVTLMRLAGKLIGKSGAVNRLTGSLIVDSSKIREELGWSPPFSMDYGLKETAEWFTRQVKE